MPVPGLPTGAAASGADGVFFVNDASNVDVWAAAGSPAGGVNLTVVVSTGVTIRSTNVVNPAMDFSGFHPSTLISLLNLGHIRGKGGDGGRGADDGIGFNGGGGGGGAGTNVGLGGVATVDINEPLSATVGVAGTATTGGAAGTNAILIAINNSGSGGEAGGDAIFMGSVPINITNGNGTIWGGGAGGAGGTITAPSQQGLNGALPGADQPSHYIYGLVRGGWAVKGSSSISFISGGSGFQLMGPVGP